VKKNVLYVGNKKGVGQATLTTIDTLSVQLTELGYTVSTSSSRSNKILRLLDMLYTVYKNRNTADVVLIDTYSTLNFQYAVFVGTLCRKLQIPYIPILHGGDLPKRLEKTPKTSARLFQNAQINIAPSHYLLEAFNTKGYANVSYIPNTISIQNYPFKGAYTGTCKLLWVRSFSEIYNPMLALDILERLVQHRDDVSLCMVGPDKDGSLLRCKESALERNLPVTFTGLLSKKEWIALAADYDVFINTTNFDNMPVSVIEAMALGIPVVSTNVGGIPYLIDGSDGVLVPPNNADAFVTAITKLLEDTATYASLKNKARNKAASFDWKIVQKSWTKILDF
jgi:glycosyltransferase involved in cell wall biosynthesis